MAAWPHRPRSRLMIQNLAAAISERRALLFVGSGVSVGLGLPSWKNLIQHMMRETGLDPGSLAGGGANYLALAEYFRIRHGSIGPLRSWMDRTFSAPEESIRSSEVFERIVALDFPIIYTTNFDRNLEEAYRLREKSYAKIANAKDLARMPESHTQIVKFHGDFDDDRSLVITETAYFDRLSFESPLDIKLRADALGKTILFVGYNLLDVNIRLLLHKMWRTWGVSGYEKDRPKSYIFMIEPDPVQEAVLAQWGVVSLSEAHAPPGDALARFLARLLDMVKL